MLKIFKKIRKSASNMTAEVASEKGTALLVALLVMGILTAVSLGVSSLIVREMGVTRLVLDSGKAYYSAESGIELGLLQLEENLPGFERSGALETVTDGGFDWQISNLANEYPYFDEENGYDVADAPSSVHYGVLELNESITIPLFVAGSDGGVKNVEKFLVQFYVDFDTDDLGVGIKSADLSGWDILRWKIYGLTKTGANGVAGVTESINDFTAASIVVNGGEESQTNAKTPSWFGSDDCTGFTNVLPSGINCATYVSRPYFETVEIGGSDGQEGLSQDVYAGTCLPTEAREHYSYDFGTSAQVVNCYPISNFLAKHNYNYLSLTNLMNPLVFKADKGEDEKLQLSRLYYRIQLGDGDSMAREFAEITSVGQSGDSKIKLSVMKKRDSVLPVFNFALYQMD